MFSSKLACAQDDMMFCQSERSRRHVSIAAPSTPLRMTPGVWYTFLLTIVRLSEVEDFFKIN